MAFDGPVVALAFTPDGAFLASATTQQILIWKVEDVAVPRARWVPEHWWATEEDHHSLSWDANGQKLAYGINNNVRSSVCLWEIICSLITVSRNRMATVGERRWTLSYN